MNKLLLYFVAAMAFLFALSVSGETQTTEQKIRDILLGSAEVGGPPHLQQIQDIQQRDNISDDQVRSVLINFITNAPPRDIDLPLSRELMENAIGAVAYYGNDSVKVLLANAIEKKQGSLRRRAIASYIRLVDYVVTGPITNILGDAAGYDDLDRRTVYEGLTKAYQPANEGKRKELLLTLDTTIRLEKGKSNFVLLDRFLVKHEPEYAKSSDRRQMLVRHAGSKPSKSSEPDRYIDHELAGIRQ